MAILHPQECYLLEKFISAEHYAATRDAIIAFIDAHEAALARYKKQMPLNSRKSLFWQQADVIWENRVMPNLRPFREQYIKAYIARTHNDIRAFCAGNAMSYIRKGIVEFSDGWMTEEEKEEIGRKEYTAAQLDKRLSITLDGEWNEGHLTYRGNPGIYTLADIPPRIPRYELDHSVRIEREGIPVQTGIYLPDIEFAPARFIPADYGQPASAIQGIRRSDWFDPDTGEKSYSWKKTEWASTGWTLIRRVEGEFIDVPPEGFFPEGKPEELYNWPQREQQLLRRKEVRITCQTGQVAPHAGRWASIVNGTTEYIRTRAGEPMPPFEDKEGRQHQTTWSLLERDDKGSVFMLPEN